jgi:apolipoprotein N-acyltransferase
MEAAKTTASSGTRAPSQPIVVLATLASAVLAYLGTGLHPLWPLLWLAPVPLLAIAARLRPRAAFLLALGAWLIGELNQWTYFTSILEAPLFLVILSLLLPATTFALAVLFSRRFLIRGSPILAAFGFPLLWVTWEYLSSISSPHSTFGNLGYTQMDCLPLIQVASITGIWGITFLVFLFAATVGALLSGAGKPAERRALAVSVGALLCAVFLFGGWRMSNPPASQTVSVTLIGRDVPLSVYLGPEGKGVKVLREYAGAVRQLTPRGTQVVVLPEKIARVSDSNSPEIDALFSAAALASSSAIDLGLVRRTPSGGYNSSRLYLPDGSAILNYDKHHLLPGVEPEKPGSRRVILEQSTGRWGLQICKDMDFPALSRQYAADGVTLMLVPAWDFGADGWLHARMAVLRAVENGFALARSARSGLLTVADDRGRILAEKPALPDRFASVTARLPVSSQATFYSRTGDWFACLCVTGSVAFLILLIARGGRT